MKNKEDVAEKKTVSEQWRHQALVDAWLSWIDARRQYMLLVLNVGRSMAQVEILIIFYIHRG